VSIETRFATIALSRGGPCRVSIARWRSRQFVVVLVPTLRQPLVSSRPRTGGHLDDHV
jgi:hypothetical protein